MAKCFRSEQTSFQADCLSLGCSEPVFSQVVQPSDEANQFSGSPSDPRMERTSFQASRPTLRQSKPNFVQSFDRDESLSSPSITTIVQPAFEEGQRATKILIDQIDGRHQEEKQQVLDCSVHWKESTIN